MILQSPSGVESDGESSTTRAVNQRSGHTVQMEGNALTSSGEGSSSTTTTITTTAPSVNSTKQKFEQA